MGERGRGSSHPFSHPSFPFSPETPDAQATRSPPRGVKKVCVGGLRRMTTLNMPRKIDKKLL